MSKKLIEENGQINSRATTHDLETICTDPTYKAYIPRVAQHRACWPELKQWVYRYVDDPIAAGIPPLPPEDKSRGKRLRVLHGAGIRLSEQLTRFTIVMIDRKKILFFLSAMAVLVSITLLPHLSSFSENGAASAASDVTSDDLTGTVTLDEAQKTVEEAKKSPAYDEQLKDRVQQLQKDIQAKDAQQAAEDMQLVKDLKLQKENVEIGNVTAELTKSIEKVGQYSDVQDIPAYKEMMDIADYWSGRSVENDDLSRAVSDSARLQQLIEKCSQAQKEREAREQSELKKREARQQQEVQEESTGSQSAPTQPPSPQLSTQIPPQESATIPQSKPQISQNSDGGVNGVVIG